MIVFFPAVFPAHPKPHLAAQQRKNPHATPLEKAGMPVLN
jgi:hypothetical protein